MNQDLLNLINHSKMITIGYSGSSYTQFACILNKVSHVRLPVDYGKIDKTQMIRMIKIDHLLEINTFYLFDSQDLLLPSKEVFDMIEETSCLLQKIGAKVITTIPLYKTITSGVEQYKMRSIKLIYKSDLVLQITDKDFKVLKSKYKIIN